MKLTNFNQCGMDNIYNYIKENNIVDEYEIKELFKSVSVNFCLEEISRYQSTIICELKDSYVQQSQRYVRVENNGFINIFEYPEYFNKNYNVLSKDNTFKKLLYRSIELYNKMSEIKDEFKDFKGRRDVSHYKYGINIEDARYILPLCAKTNMSISMSGDKFLKFLNLINIPFKNFEHLSNNENNFYLDSLFKDNVQNNDYYNSLFENLLIGDENVILNSKFKNPESIISIGASISGSSKIPSELKNEYCDIDKSKRLIERVVGYGHTSIIEQNRTTFLLKMSLNTYHQFLRHRLPTNHREALINLTNHRRTPYIPESIFNSEFYNEYLDLVNDFYNFRYQLKFYNVDDRIVNLCLLNCDQICLMSNTNILIEQNLLKDRICNTAQTEIRKLSIKKFNLLNDYSSFLYKNCLPPCINGKCKEGKLTCGKQEDMKKRFILDQ
jgi:thymidylate synthase ThyX